MRWQRFAAKEGLNMPSTLEAHQLERCPHDVSSFRRVEYT
ncbi:hypothetical protein PC120_g16766 [Phytophthora cactorum]|nr:hypothetical protein PC120_g16766 [Phytophthora cactorum]